MRDFKNTAQPTVATAIIAHSGKVTTRQQDWRSHCFRIALAVLFLSLFTLTPPPQKAYAQQSTDAQALEMQIQKLAGELEEVQAKLAAMQADAAARDAAALNKAATLAAQPVPSRNAPANASAALQPSASATAQSLTPPVAPGTRPAQPHPRPAASTRTRSII